MTVVVHCKSYVTSHALTAAFSPATDAPECRVARKVIGIEGRTMLVCEAVAAPAVVKFTWFKHNRTLTAVSATGQQTHPAAYNDKNRDDSGAGDDSAVIVAPDSDLDAYSCVATNVIGASRPCKLLEANDSPNGVSGEFSKREQLV